MGVGGRRLKEMDWSRKYVNHLVERGRLHVPESDEIKVMPPPPRPADDILHHSDLDLSSEEAPDSALHYDCEYQVADISFGSKADAVGGTRGRYRFLQLVREARTEMEVL